MHESFKGVGAERRDRAHRVRLLSAALRAGMRRSPETWRSIHLLLLRLFTALPVAHKTLSPKEKKKKKKKRTPGVRWFVLSPAAEAAAGKAFLKAETHDDERRRGGRTFSAPAVNVARCLKSLLAVQRSTCAPQAPDSLSPSLPPPLSLLLLLFLVRPPLLSPGGRPTSPLLPPPLHLYLHHPPRRYHNLAWYGLCSLGIKTWWREFCDEWMSHHFNPFHSLWFVAFQKWYITDVCHSVSEVLCGVSLNHTFHTQFYHMVSGGYNIPTLWYSILSFYCVFSDLNLLHGVFKSLLVSCRMLMVTSSNLTFT